MKAKEICKALVEEVKDYLPFHYSSEVMEFLGKETDLKAIQRVKNGKSANITIATAINKLGKAYKNAVANQQPSA
jgi:hypothetical protein